MGLVLVIALFSAILFSLLSNSWSAAPYQNQPVEPKAVDPAEMISQGVDFGAVSTQVSQFVQNANQLIHTANIGLGVLCAIVAFLAFSPIIFFAFEVFYELFNKKKGEAR